MGDRLCPGSPVTTLWPNIHSHLPGALFYLDGGRWFGNDRRRGSPYGHDVVKTPDKWVGSPSFQEPDREEGPLGLAMEMGPVNAVDVSPREYQRFAARCRGRAGRADSRWGWHHCRESPSIHNLAPPRPLPSLYP